jgi:hypothetical protein
MRMMMMSKNGISAGWCALLYAVALVSLVSTARAQGSSEMQDLTLGTPGTGQFVVGYDSTDTGDDPAGTAKRYAFPPWSPAMTGQSLTGSQSTSLLDLATTWNTTGTPTALKLNVTDTASNASSLLMDLQVGGTSKFKVTKSGAVTVADIDVAGDLYLKNSTTATQGRIYNTYTDASNGEWLSLDWATTNIATIKTTGNGTGTVTPRALRLESQDYSFLHQTGGVSNLFAGCRSGNYALTGIGNTAAGNLSGVLLSTGSYNVIMGALALDAETTGSSNIAIGYRALSAQNGVGGSVAIGHQAGLALLSGGQNTIVGYAGLDAETTGSNNVAVGFSALSGQNGATYNTAVGRSAGLLLSTGSNNTILGGLAGDNLTTGASNIIIGASVDAQSATASGQISIGNLIFGTAVATGTTASTGNVGIGVVAPVNKLSVDGTIKSKTYTVATLPAAATVGQGATAFVSDGSVVHASNSGTIVAGSGANFVPVYSDGTNWRIQ